MVNQGRTFYKIITFEMRYAERGSYANEPLNNFRQSPTTVIICTELNKFPANFIIVSS
jgi:hypothetical protein